MIIKEKENEIYILFYCDPWKSECSMRLAAVCTTIEKAKSAVAAAIRSGCIKYGYNDRASKEDMVKLFHEDCENRCLRDINDRLWGGFLDTAVDGETYQ